MKPAESILGLGRELAAQYLLQSNTIVLATVRNPKHPTSQSLHDLPRGSESRLVIFKVDSMSDTDTQDAVNKFDQSTVSTGSTLV